MLRDLLRFEVPDRDHLAVAVHCEGGIEILEGRRLIKRAEGECEEGRQKRKRKNEKG